MDIKHIFEIICVVILSLLPFIVVAIFKEDF